LAGPEIPQPKLPEFIPNPVPAVPLIWAYSNAVEVCVRIRTHEEIEMKYVKLGILIGYSVCWGYILIKSMILWYGVHLF
jgi:hypothetical protein